MSQAFFSKIVTIQHPDRRVPIGRMPWASARMTAAPSGVAASISDRGGLTHPGVTTTSTAGFRTIIGAPPPPDVGERTFQFRVPDGMQIDKAQAIALPESTQGAFVELLPGISLGGTGDQQIKVRYSVPAGGTIRLRVRVYGKAQPTPEAGHSEEAEIEALYIRDMQSVQRMGSLMASRKRFVIVMDGPEVDVLESTGFFNDGLTWNVSNGPFGPIVKINPAISTAVLITAIITAGVVGSLVIICLTWMITHAINHCYRINVHAVKIGEVKLGGGLFKPISLELPSLVFDMEPTDCS